ncbi:MAG: hotdog fold thioesterase [Polyangiaceae bacterium]|nr:hotdog fold thioesterase [Polyangiaceae bacterium]
MPADAARYSAEELDRFCRTMVEQRVQRALGLELLSLVDGRAVCRVPVDEDKDGGGGYLHGGFVSMAVEAAAFFSAIGVARRGQWPATVDLHVALLRSARIGSALVLRAELSTHTRTLAVVRVDVVERRAEGDEAVVAVATVTKAYRDVAR